MMDAVNNAHKFLDNELNHPRDLHPDTDDDRLCQKAIDKFGTSAEVAQAYTLVG